MTDADRIRTRFEVLHAFLDERLTRLWAAAEARAVGRGGLAAVTAATGIGGQRIRDGMHELRAPPPARGEASPRIRRPGAGRKPVLVKYPMLASEIEALMSPAAPRGAPPPLRWTCMSKAQIARALGSRGYPISETKVGHLLHELGYSLRRPLDARRPQSSERRRASFERLTEQVADFGRRRLPIVSLELQRWMADAGPSAPADGPWRDPSALAWRAERRAGGPPDAPWRAARALLSWWTQAEQEGRERATDLLVVVRDGDGPALAEWRPAMHWFTRTTGAEVTLGELPPGISRWTRIERRVLMRAIDLQRGGAAVRDEVVMDLISP